jgi:hypothetical protein
VRSSSIGPADWMIGRLIDRLDDRPADRPAINEHQ